jgi:hypothetical protein
LLLRRVDFRLESPAVAKQFMDRVMCRVLALFQLYGVYSRSSLTERSGRRSEQSAEKEGSSLDRRGTLWETEDDLSGDSPIKSTLTTLRSRARLFSFEHLGADSGRAYVDLEVYRSKRVNIHRNTHL